MNDKDIENGIRLSLQKEFPDSAFSVSYWDERLDISILGGDLKKYNGMFPEEIEDRIQNAVFEVAPILIQFEDVYYL